MFKTQAIVAAAVCTVSLFAAPAAFAKSIEVTYGDLDLTTVSGQAELDKRITTAARRVCRVDRPTTGTRIAGMVDHACYEQALSNSREPVATAIARADDGTRLGG
ncbi:UrcA family protein [Novosphingobium panipatense]|uniref:UrcA family protein n=1 Tax=Novosphingobium panipatense TaxID=428991 RepID=A0ABY1QGK3_9SPHN|nr:UrcA family protein [Novosphingobium panipatense]SMP67703.1 UrcA family protein [Novosphingobium panipatense]